MNTQIQMLGYSTLHCHEEVDVQKVYQIMQSLQKSKRLRKPIIVDQGTYIILDGHHRFQALKNLGFTQIPCVLVCYQDANIHLSFRRKDEEEQLLKEAVISQVLSGKLFPQKTTRHRVSYRPIKPIRLVFPERRCL